MNRNNVRSLVLANKKRHFELVDYQGTQLALQTPTVQKRVDILSKHAGVDGKLTTAGAVAMMVESLISELCTVNEDGTPGEPVLEATDLEALLSEPSGNSLVDVLGPAAIRVLNGAPVTAKEAMAAAKND
jgi:hypothetical protein